MCILHSVHTIAKDCPKEMLRKIFAIAIQFVYI